MPKFPLACLLAALGSAALASPALAGDDTPAASEVLLCGGGDADEDRQCTVIDNPGACFIILDDTEERFEADPVPAPPLA